MQCCGESNSCCCPVISYPPCPPSCPPPPPPNTKSSKYYQEIGAEMIGNQLIIRIEKDKNKLKKKKYLWSPPCDCETVEIQRPTKKEGPKIIDNGTNDNRILFRIHSRSHLGAKDDPNYKPQAIAYKVGSCKGEDTNDQCRKITIYPRLGAPGSHEVHSDHLTEGNQDIFFLRIKKKPESAEQKRRNIELELRTPKPPTMSTSLTPITPSSAKLVVEENIKSAPKKEEKRVSRKKEQRK